MDLCVVGSLIDLYPSLPNHLGTDSVAKLLFDLGGEAKLDIILN